VLFLLPEVFSFKSLSKNFFFVLNLILKLLRLLDDATDLKVFFSSEIGTEIFVCFIERTLGSGFVTLFFLLEFESSDFLLKMLSFFDEFSDFVYIIFLGFIFNNV
jgi:hypothetical protein